MLPDFDRSPGLYRLGMLVLAAIQSAVTAWALVSPRGFHDNFPGAGHRWLPPLGPFNEHMIVDYGAFTLSGVAALVAGAIVLERRAVQVALVAWLAGATPHLIYHLTALEPYPLADGLANVIGLGLYVVLPLGLLVGIRRSAARSAAAPTARAEA